MSTFSIDSSYATRAEWRSGVLLSALSSIVLMFQHASFSACASLKVDVYLPFLVLVRPLQKMPVDRG